MKWNVKAARDWMFQVGMDHIKEGLFPEGGELVFEAKWGNGCDTKKLFRDTFERVCGWSKGDVDDAVYEILHGKENEV